MGYLDFVVVSTKVEKKNSQLQLSVLNFNIVK